MNGINEMVISRNTKTNKIKTYVLFESFIALFESISMNKKKNKLYIIKKKKKWEYLLLNNFFLSLFFFFNKKIINLNCK